MKLAICFLTTNEKHFNLNILKQQIKDSKLHNIDLYVYVDNNDNYVIKDNITYFNYQYLKNKFNYQHTYYSGNVNGSTVFYKAGMQFLPWLDMYTNHKDEYDMYLFFEDDVSYFSDKNLFDSIDFNCDALFQNKRITVEEDEWWWWYHSEYKIDRNKIQKTFHGLLNIYGCKQHIINDFINFLNEDNYIHHELLLSAFILNNCNIKVNYVDDYFKCYFTYINKYSLEEKYDFVHPVKTLEKYNFLNNLK